MPLLVHGHQLVEYIEQVTFRGLAVPEPGGAQ